MNAKPAEIRAHLTRVHELICVEYMLTDGEMSELLKEEQQLFERQHEHQVADYVHQLMA
jgi:hypothetical protein